MFFSCFFVRSTISRQPVGRLHVGVLWFQMRLLPFWGLAAPRGVKKGKWNFRYYRSQWGIFAFWRFLSYISATRGQIYAKFYTCRDSVFWRAPSPSAVHRPLGAQGGRVKHSKNGGWSHSCCRQLPFLFFSALPNVVQYVGRRPAHILVQNCQSRPRRFYRVGQKVWKNFEFFTISRLYVPISQKL